MVGTGTAVSCTDAALNAALAGGGLVTFNCGGPATIDISTGTGTKTISTDTTIDGGSLTTISGGKSVSIFSVNPGVMFTVQNLTIANGNSPDAGAGVANSGTLTVINSTFSGNSAHNSGGGILNDGGALTVTHSSFASNDAKSGGAILSSGTATVTDSTFSGNSAAGVGVGIVVGLGGGIYNGGTATLTNVTISGNSARNSGGGIANSGTLTVTNCTFVENTAGTYGGGISFIGGVTVVTNSTLTRNVAMGCFAMGCNLEFSGGGIAGGPAFFATGVVELRNTIVANNLNPNCIGSSDGGHNLDDGASCGFIAANGSLSNTNPQLDPAGLKDNGGPTQTIALLANSPAINAGAADVCATAPVNGVDQRGYLRPGTGSANCSIGAYEYNSPGPPPSCVGDCNHNSAVAITELVTLVNIVLGSDDVTTCAAGDANGDAAITIDEIIRAVNVALSGCPAPVVCGGIMGLACGTGEVCDLRDPTCAVADLEGLCVPGPLPCPMGGDPVCGCDGVTYPNDCARLNADATLAHTGACIDGP